METKIETEAKIRISNNSFEKIISILGKPNFVTQRNDFFRNSLGKVVRLRFENDLIILNRKTRLNYFTNFKSKKEEEIVLLNKEVEKILLFFGFKKFFSYKKERADFDMNNCIISLDKLEANQCFVEIEGEEGNIEKVIDQLNLRGEFLEKRSYLELLGGENGLYRKNL